MKPPILLAIADDHVMFRKGVVAVIGRLNVQFVAEAANGKELIDKIEALSVPPQVCIVDINMPVMDGYATLAVIRQRWPQIKVLMLSMLSSEAIAKKVLGAGATACLQKDDSPEELERAVQAIIDSWEVLCAE